MGRAAKITSIAAVCIGAAAEGILVWFVDQLPTWAQWIVYGIPVVACVAGFAIALRERHRRRSLS